MFAIHSVACHINKLFIFIMQAGSLIIMFRGLRDIVEH